MDEQGSFCLCAQPKRDDVISPLIGWAHTEDDPWTSIGMLFQDNGMASKKLKLDVFLMISSWMTPTTFMWKSIYRVANIYVCPFITVHAHWWCFCRMQRVAYCYHWLTFQLLTTTLAAEGWKCIENIEVKVMTWGLYTCRKSWTIIAFRTWMVNHVHVKL